MAEQAFIFDTGKHYKNVLTHPNFGSDQTTTGTLYKDLQACLCVEVAGWGICREPCLLLSWLCGESPPSNNYWGAS
jgi:hypothetical protein